MMWQAEFPHVSWEWRVFCGHNFVGYITATTQEIAEAQTVMKMVLDFDYQTIEVI